MAVGHQDRHTVALFNPQRAHQICLPKDALAELFIGQPQIAADDRLFVCMHNKGAFEKVIFTEWYDHSQPSRLKDGSPVARSASKLTIRMSPPRSICLYLLCGQELLLSAESRRRWVSAPPREKTAVVFVVLQCRFPRNVCGVSS